MFLSHRIKPLMVSFAIFMTSTLAGVGSSSQFIADPGTSGSTPSDQTRILETIPFNQTPVLHREDRAQEPYRLFPSLLRPPRIERGVYGPRLSGLVPDGGPVMVEAETAVVSTDRQPLLAGNQVLAFYGKPGSKSMGILGEYSKEQIAPLLEGYAKLYDDANGMMGVVPAFYIIFGTCWPEGEIGFLRRSIVEEYIQFAADKGWIVFLDHQLGKFGVEESVQSMLPYLQYPNVHLAIDPEWRTLKPMQEIGSITGTELNEAQRMIDSYLIEHNLPGIRMLVVHQFRSTMIRDMATVNAGFDRVVLVHTADGFGSPELKKNTYAWNARALNMPVKGFKLFFESSVAGAGWDKPLMLPEEVLALEPMPLVVMYQ
jgi:hypothetical protein